MAANFEAPSDMEVTYGMQERRCDKRAHQSGTTKFHQVCTVSCSNKVISNRHHKWLRSRCMPLAHNMAKYKQKWAALPRSGADVGVALWLALLSNWQRASIARKLVYASTSTRTQTPISNWFMRIAPNAHACSELIDTLPLSLALGKSHTRNHEASTAD